MLLSQLKKGAVYRFSYLDEDYLVKIVSLSGTFDGFVKCLPLPRAFSSLMVPLVISTYKKSSLFHASTLSPLSCPLLEALK